MPTSSPSSDNLISLALAADRCGVQPKTLRRWIAEGRLTGYRMGPKLLRVDTAELDRLAAPIPTAGSTPAA